MLLKNMKANASHRFILHGTKYLMTVNGELGGGNVALKYSPDGRNWETLATVSAVGNREFQGYITQNAMITVEGGTAQTDVNISLIQAYH